MSEDYFDNLLKARVTKRMRPFQYLMAHIFVMVATIILMAFGMEYGIVNEDLFLAITIPLILSIIAHALWYGSQAMHQRIEFEEIQKLRNVEKPKRDTRRLEDGELVEYDDFLQDSTEASLTNR